MPHHAENTCFAERVAPSWVGPDDECVTALHALTPVMFRHEAEGN
jgi:hypothetical protein